MSILDKIPSLAENELFQKLAAIEDITALCKEDQEPELEIFPGAVTVRMLRHLSDSLESFLESQVSLC